MQVRGEVAFMPSDEHGAGEDAARPQDLETGSGVTRDGLHGTSAAARLEFLDGIRRHRAVADEDAGFFHPLAAHGKRVPEFRAMSTVAEIIEAVKELPETEKGVLFRELDPLREPEASRGSLARKNGRWVLRGGEAAAAADAWETTRESRSRELPG